MNGQREPVWSGRSGDVDDIPLLPWPTFDTQDLPDQSTVPHGSLPVWRTGSGGIDDAKGRRGAQKRAL